jgi:mRNA-degrading endonuclease RelE of RelBE toxin-antitoxin system
MAEYRLSYSRAAGSDLRVVYEISDTRREVLVTRVRHRREAYRD